ncbi:MAG: lactonase family protein [Candidatus Acidiferrum sp.]
MNITHRFLVFFLLISSLAALAFTAAAPRPAADSHYLALVGTYTNKTDSKGIYAFDFDSASGKLTPKGVAVQTPDPSFLTIHPSGKYTYAVNESGKKSMVGAFALDPQSGKLTLLNQLPALGEDPCYLSFDKTGKYVLIANYSSGNVVVFPILPDGKLGEHTANVKDAGAVGPNKERQEGPHAHWIEVSGHNRFVYVADLGLDRVLIYKFDASKGTLTPGETPASDPKATSPSPSNAFSAVLNPGTGPRHVAFSHDGNFMYVLGEIQSTVTVFANDAREIYREIQRISTLPEGFSGRNDTAEIAVHSSGKWLYASNRGHDSVAVFAVHPTSGRLELTGDFPTGGKEPRHFAIDPTGRFLLAENQNSNSIAVFRIDPATGALAPTGETASVPSPVCLAFLPHH